MLFHTRVYIYGSLTAINFVYDACTNVLTFLHACCNTVSFKGYYSVNLLLILTHLTFEGCRLGSHNDSKHQEIAWGL